MGPTMDGATLRFTARARWRVIVAALVALLAVVGTALPASAADRLGNSGRGTGWTLTGIPGNPGRDVWFGTHLVTEPGARLIDALCLDFARVGPREVPAPPGDYQTYSRTTGFDVADRQLAYLATVVGQRLTSDGLENDAASRNLAAAATAATWGVGETAGFDARTPAGRGVWSSAWLNNDVSFLRSSSNDPGADVASITELFRQLRMGGHSLAFGQSVLTVAGNLLGAGSAPGAITANLAVPAVGPVPLVPVRVDYAANLTGITAGQMLRTDQFGNVGPIQVALTDPTKAGWVSLTSMLAPDKPLLWQSSVILGKQRLGTSVQPPTASGPGGLRIRKDSTDPTLSVTGTRFEVRNATGVLMGHLVVAADGFTTTLPVPAGAYDLVEIETTPEHTLHATVRASVVTDLITTAFITNTPSRRSEPNVTTQVSAPLVAVGETVTDTILMSGLVGAETATVELELYDLDAIGPGGVPGTPLARFVYAGLGNGEKAGLAPYVVPPGMAGHTLGYRERVVTTTAATPALPRSTDWSVLGVVTETFRVPGRDDPKIDTVVQPGDMLTSSSAVSASAIPVGTTVHDSIYIDGLAEGETATIEIELYDRTTAPPVFVSRFTQAGLSNGWTSGLAPYAASAAVDGHEFVYRERIVTTTAKRSTEWSSLDEHREKFWVGKIWLSSQVSASSVAVGATVSDTVYLNGLAPGETGTVELELFDLTTDPDGSGSPIVNVRVDALIDGVHAGLAPYIVTADRTGHRMGYRHRLVSTTAGRSTPWSWLGDWTETFDIGRIGVSTSVSSSVAKVGSIVTDAVYIEGLAPGETATAELQLFDLTTDPQGAGQPLASWSEPGLVNGNNVGLAGYTVPAGISGHRLGYRERLTTSTGRTTEWSELGVPSETFLVGDVVCGTDAVRARNIFDNVVISGLEAGELATVELELYDLTIDPTGLSPLARFTLTRLGNGTSTGGDYVVPDSANGHRLSYRERIVSTTAGRTTPWSELGKASETVTVCLP